MRSISFRLLLFNVLLLFFPLGSLLYLDTYENQMLSSQENSMIQQGRIFSSALAGRDLAAESRRILENLKLRVDSRIRVVDAEGRLLADSAAFLPPGNAAAAGQDSPDPEYSAPPPVAQSGMNETLLYRIAVYPLNIVKKVLFPPQANYSGAEYYSGRRILLGPEIQAALEGRYGAATRISSGGQVSVNLYSAIPIPGEKAGAIAGAVLVSRSSYGILVNLYRLRLDIIKIFLASLAFSLALSLILSFSITRPIKKLKNEAERVLDKAGHFTGHFRGLRRKDEIGDLSRSLSGLSQKLEKRIGFIDAFTSDLLHELKNPLAAIRGQAELALASPVKEERLLRGIKREEQRMERFLARLRELSRIDNALEREETEDVDLCRFFPLLLESRGSAPGDPRGIHIQFTPPSGSGPALVRVNSDRLFQALINPLENAVSYSPPGGTVTAALRRAEPPSPGAPAEWEITIDDEGPGIREASGDRYFERFYSERPQEEKEHHSGLGLAIVRAITAGYGGRCSLANRTEGGRVQGCRFTLILPDAG
ncbi:MAG: HAMP domain-containing protein [Treponema sp.]|jgi:two-component system sensor histidine kinase ChvG|nr:HAMP domain-containing protein [Treponema sp.]